MSPLAAARVLRVSLPCDEATAKAAYRRAVLAHHPDRGGRPEDMARVNAAYEVLKGGGDAPNPTPQSAPPPPGESTRPGPVPEWIGDLLSEVAQPDRASELGRIIGRDRVDAVQAGIWAFLAMSGSKRKKRSTKNG